MVRERNFRLESLEIICALLYAIRVASWSMSLDVSSLETQHLSELHRALSRVEATWGDCCSKGTQPCGHWSIQWLVSVAFYM
jgi:hypothetical protein